MHTIRLRGPWRYEFLEPVGGTSRGHLQLPGDWASVLDDGRRLVRFSRSFHAPTGIGAEDRVHLTLTNLCDPKVRLNGVPQSRQTQLKDSNLSLRFDITGVLAVHNELTIEIELVAGQECVGQVNLEISTNKEETSP